MADEMTADLESYFWSKVVTEPNCGCWIWIGALMSSGYGMFSLRGMDNRSAHRWSYKHFKKRPIPEKMDIDHLCRIRCCVNPDHLEAVSHRENVLRSDTPSARNARKMVCNYGHAFTPENTYVSPGEGERRCITCDSRRRAESQARRDQRRRELAHG